MAGCADLHRLVQILPVKQHLGNVGIRFGAVVDRADGEFPVARESGTFQRQAVAHFETVGVGELAADDGTLAVAQKCAQLFVLEKEIGIHREIGGRLDRELREEVLRVLIDAAEPSRVGHRAHAVHRADLVAIGERQREGKRNAVSRHQSRGRRLVGGSVPGADHGGQDAERDQSHGESEHREARTHLVAEYVAEDEFQEWHGDRGMDGHFGVGPCMSLISVNHQPAATLRPRDSFADSSPFSKCMMAWAHSAARRSCVTITMVLPSSTLSRSMSARISSAD